MWWNICERNLCVGICVVKNTLININPNMIFAFLNYAQVVFLDVICSISYTTNMYYKYIKSPPELLPFLFLLSLFGSIVICSKFGMFLS